MEKNKLIGLLLFLIIIPVSCEKFDDTELWEELNSLERRITAVENQLKLVNNNLASLRELTETLQNRRYVTGVTEVVGGYILTFSDGSKITIEDGKDGADGKDGKDGVDGVDGKDGADGSDAPVINVRYFNGRYYWTQTTNGQTSWLTDSEGNMIPASGTDGVTPLMKIDSDGYWIISYNDGQSFSRLLNENGSPVKALGSDGDSMFTSVEIFETELRIVLADGTEIIMPIGEQLPYSGIDLGLSVKWSSINFGAESSSEFGGLYLWGDVNNSGIVPYYNAPNLYYISGTGYDIVRANWGESWRIPNMNEMRELVNGCEWRSATVNGVNGTRVTGSNGNSILIPNTGYGLPKSGPIGETERVALDNGYYYTGESYLLNSERMGYALYITNSAPALNYTWNVNIVKMAIRPVRGY